MYYLLTNILDYEITGPVFRQIENMESISNSLNDDLVNCNQALLYTPDLSFTAAQKAKITDYLSCPSQYLIINEKLLKIFLEYKLESYQYFSTKVNHRKKQYNYYLFFIYGQNFDWVDYKNMKFIGKSNPPYSDFYREPHEKIGAQKKEIKVENPEHLINWQKLYPDYPNREYENVILNYANINSDMIRTPTLLGNHYLVSEALKNSIEQLGCTGMQFRTTDIFNRAIL
ncbi:MAG: hypothetical protein JNL70_27370 [Saprospiraceae bacterium]|nr:hypothetical protein [Saprospiraceae bacterium]